MSDIIKLNIDPQSRECTGVELCEKALQLARSGQLRGIVIIGLHSDHSKRFIAKCFLAEDSSEMIGEVSVALHTLADNQIKDTSDDS